MNKEYWLIEVIRKKSKIPFNPSFRIIDRVTEAGLIYAKDEFMARNKLKGKEFIIAESKRWYN